MSADNEEAIGVWNGVLFDTLLRLRHLVAPAFGGYSELAFSAHPPKPGARVLDVGCGAGDTTLELARLVGPQGEAVGVDAAPRFVELATAEAKERDTKNASFLLRDAETDDLGTGFDLVFSRFGSTYFAHPMEAFRNLRRALRPDGSLCLIVWRKREDNPVFLLPQLAVQQLIDVPEEHEDTGPVRGPLALADADRTSDLLLRAGFSRITFERRDAPLLMGKGIDEAVEFAMAFGPAGELLRRAGDEGERQKPSVAATLRRVLGEFSTKDGVIAPSSAWIVTATAEGT